MIQKGLNSSKGDIPQSSMGLGNTEGGKTNGRKLINGVECVQFERKEQFGTVQPTQTAAVLRPTKGKATKLSPDQNKPSKQVMYRQKQFSHKPKELIWATPKKYAYQPKAHAP